MLAPYLFLPLPANLPERSRPPDGADQPRLRRRRQPDRHLQAVRDVHPDATPEDIPEVLKQAVVAAEDRSFYSHGGVDLRGTLRALVADLRNQRGRAGRLDDHPAAREDHHATTARRGRSSARSARRCSPASSTARWTRTRSSSSTSRTSTWARAPTARPPPPRPTSASPCRSSRCRRRRCSPALIPAPSRYSPRVDPARRSRSGRSSSAPCSTRGRSTRPTHDAALAEALWLAVERARRPGPATVVYPPETQQSTDPYFTDYVLQVARGAPARAARDQIYRGGLRIETTLDPDQQAAARQQVADFLEGTAARPPRVAGRGRAAHRLRAGVHLRRRRLRDRPGQLRARRHERRRRRRRRLGPPARLGVQAVRAGRRPSTRASRPEARYSGAPHDVTEACGKDAEGEDVVLENYGGGSYGTLGLRDGHVEVGQHRLHPAHPRRRRGQDDGPGQGDGPHRRARLRARQVLRLGRPRRRVGVAARHGVGLRRVRRPRRLRAEPTPVLRVIDRDGNVLIDNSEPASDPGAEGGRGRQRHRHPPGRARSRHRRGSRPRPARRRQDRHHPGQQGRLVRRLHARRCPPRCGWATRTRRRQPRAEAACATSRASRKVTGGTHPARIWQAFMNEALRERAGHRVHRAGADPRRARRGQAAPARRLRARAPASSPATPARAGPTSRSRSRRPRSHRPRPSVRPARPPPRPGRRRHLRLTPAPG